MKYQKELNLSVGLCRHSLATNVTALLAVASFITYNNKYRQNFILTLYFSDIPKLAIARNACCA